jgi:MarR family transcriptional regulator for hemolysin
MPERRLQDVFFYSLESAIKSYRRFAQARIEEGGFDITIDQWLVLKTIEESPAASRRSSLRLTRAGVALIRELEPIIRVNRRQALQGLSATEIERMRKKLALITANCRPRQREDQINT